MNITINGCICTTLDDVKEHASEDVYTFLSEYVNDESAIVAHTSGSTGTPKEIRLNKSDMRASARLTNDFFNLNENSIFFLNLSPQYIAGKMMIVRAYELNAAIYEEEPSNEPLKNYNRNELIDLGAFVPSQMVHLIQNPEKLCMFKNIIIGGGRLPQRLERWLAEKGVNAYMTYGMTETCSHVALRRVGLENHQYTALGEVTFDIDQRGCLIINAPQFETANITTNDMVDLVDSTHFYWRGRADNVINSGGIKIFPEEIEPAIAKYIHHALFFVTSEPSDKWGEELVLVVEYPSLQAGEIIRGAIQKELVEKLKKDLQSHQIPKRYIAIKQFRQTTTGKIIRQIQP